MRNNIEKSYADKVRELNDAEKQLKEAWSQSWMIFLDTLGKKLRLYDLLDLINNKFKN